MAGYGVGGTNYRRRWGRLPEKATEAIDSEESQGKLEETKEATAMDYLVTRMAVVAERFLVMVAVERFLAVVITGKFPVVVEMVSSEGFDFAGTEAGEIKKEHRIMALEICCCVEFTGPLVSIVGLFMNSGVTLFSLAVSALQSLRIHVLDEMSEENEVELLHMYRRDRLILLKYLLSGTLIKKAVMPAGAVSLDDVDLHQVSVDFVLNSVKKVACLSSQKPLETIMIVRDTLIW
ncbi:hypothetical protein L2E82_44380 [Cichorium intybus]|uniref:Uncharacterized protein n=1 Tax=Cichorium intybus TaxID=13427 RepID=A0ACB8ZP89_CICIN|nr:hypothetical protein L2E82_44380 [Cichorium intybus]